MELPLGAELRRCRMESVQRVFAGLSGRIFCAWTSTLDGYDATQLSRDLVARKSNSAIGSFAIKRDKEGESHRVRCPRDQAPWPYA